MKTLILGADGFVGRNVYAIFKQNSAIKTISASRSGKSDYTVDLGDRSSILNVLETEKPDVIVNCVGVVVNTQDAYQNGIFCRNLLESVLASGVPFPRIVTSGSAAEYGIVETSGRVSEDVELLATSDYGKSKIEEEAIAHEYANNNGIKLAVARIFNPIGPGMGEKFLLSNLLGQLDKIKNSEADSITISRLDSLRDYVDVRDVARGMYLIAITSDSRHDVYNIGSGRATSNKQLLEQLLLSVELNVNPTIIETQEAAEPRYAAQADVSRLESEFGWRPEYTLAATVEDIVNAKSNQ